MASSSDKDVAALMRRLELAARDLVGSDLARDLAHETWLRATQARREGSRPPWRWWKVVMRRTWMRSRSREISRRDGERFAARAEGADPRSTLERASTAEWLLAELRRLGEPYEGVLRMRYLEGRSVRDIAKASGRTPETVRSQVHRALVRLRAQLDRRAGSRDAWVGVLVAASIGGGDAGAAAGADVVPKRRGIPLALAGVGAAVIVTVAWIARSERPDERALAPAGVALARAAPDEAGTPARRPLAPAVEPPAPAPDASAAAVPADVARLRVVVRDRFGAPVRGVFGDFFGRDRESLYDGELGADGMAVIDVSSEQLIDDPRIFGDVVLSVRSPELAWSPTLGVRLETAGERVVEVVLDQKSCVLRGVVIDERGRPVGGATVDTMAAPAELVELEPGLVACHKVVETRTDADGRFQFEGLPPIPHAVRVHARDLLEQTVRTLPRPSDEALELTVRLERTAALEGVVYRPGGTPIASAVVEVAQSFRTQRFAPSAKTDEHGRYRLEGFAWGRPTRVFAFDAEDSSLFEATTVEVPRGAVGAFDAVLRATPGVRVLVVRADGTPAAGALVVAAAESPVSDWSAAITVGDDGRGVLLHVPDEPLELRVFPEELVGSGDPQAFRRGVRPAAEEIVLELSAELPLDGSLAGRALRDDGRPAGRTVAVLTIEGLAERDALPDGRMRFGGAGRLEAVAGSDGSFRFENLESGRYHVYLVRDGADRMGALDAGIHVVPPDGHLDLGAVRFPEPHRVRFVRGPGSSDDGEVSLCLVVPTGPYGHPLSVRPVGAGLELRLFPGRYLLRASDMRGVRELEVDGDLTVELPEGSARRCPAAATGTRR